MSAGIVIGAPASPGSAAARRCGPGGGRTHPARRRRGTPAPYDRPPLSKGLLAGTTEAARVALRAPGGWHAEHGVELVLGTAATGLDAGRRQVLLAGGRRLRYDRLVVATGGAPRVLAILRGRTNVHVLRTLDDALALRAVLGPGVRLAVVGAGLVGLEVAATARALGAAVTVVEAAPAPLAAVLGERIGRWLAELHRAAGVEVLTGVTIEAAHGGAHVGALRLADGRRSPATPCSWPSAWPRPPAGWTAAGSPGRDRRRPRGSHPPALGLRGRRRARSRPLGGGRPPGSHRGGDHPRRPRLRRRRRRPSGAISTACACSSPAPLPATTAWRSTATPSPAMRAPSFTAAAGSSEGCSSGAPATCLPCANACRRPPSNTNGAQHDPPTHRRSNGLQRPRRLRGRRARDLPRGRHGRRRRHGSAGPRHGGRRGVPRGGHLGRRRGDRPPLYA